MLSLSDPFLSPGISSETGWEEAGGSYSCWDNSRNSAIQLPAFDQVVFMVCGPRRKNKTQRG